MLGVLFVVGCCRLWLFSLVFEVYVVYCCCCSRFVVRCLWFVAVLLLSVRGCSRLLVQLSFGLVVGIAVRLRCCVLLIFLFDVLVMFDRRCLLLFVIVCCALVLYVVSSLVVIACRRCFSRC